MLDLRYSTVGLTVGSRACAIKKWNMGRIKWTDSRARDRNLPSDIWEWWRHERTQDGFPYETLQRSQGAPRHIESRRAFTWLGIHLHFPDCTTQVACSRRNMPSARISPTPYSEENPEHDWGQ